MTAPEVGSVVSAYIPTRSRRHQAVYVGGHDEMYPWRLLDGNGGDTADMIGPNNVEDVRPLVVIDPEDREQVEQLAKAFHESDHIAPWHDLHSETRAQIEAALAVALREFADPKPRIEEPTGLGAVVVDANGVKWVRVEGEYRHPWFTPRENNVREFANIDAVRVLSDGWSE